ncbi:hypothetical protein [Kitasatospora sp. NPDC094016]|uniref:hypothetical protein n=1 Tax=Kitasatospora sp. NPDC094016 TaxID=3154986 RepID=UPI00332B952C
MTVGPRTGALITFTRDTTIRAGVRAAYAALTQACRDSGDNAHHAELVGEHPRYAWLLPHSNALAVIHDSEQEACELLACADLLRECRVPVVPAYYGRPLVVGRGRAVTFWHNPGRYRPAPGAAARVTAAVHGIKPAGALWLREHHPFNDLLDGLEQAPLNDSTRDFLYEHTARVRTDWQHVRWPTTPTVILATTGPARCHDDGDYRLLLRTPLRLGHREWDLVAARWRSELLYGHLENQRTYTVTYASCSGSALAREPIGSWPDYQVVRDAVVLTEVMETVRGAHQDDRTRQAAEHQVACLRGAHQAPWRWGTR